MLTRLVHAMTSPLCAVDKAGRVLAANEAFAALLGVPVAEACATDLAGFLSAGDAALLRERFANPGQTAPLAIDWRGARSGGGAALVDVFPLGDESLIVARGIENEARQATENVDRTLREYHSILANAPVGIGFSLNRRTVRYNQRFAEIFGYRGDEGIGRPTRELYDSDEAYAEVGAQAFPLLSKGLPFEAEMQMRRQDDTLFWAHAVAYLVDPADPAQGTIWIISDIDDKKAMQDALDRSLLELTAIFDNASVAILFSRNRVIERCNRRGAEILGYASPEELVGQPGQTVYPDVESYARVGREAGPLLAAGQSFSSDWQLRRKDGSTVWCRLYARAVDPQRTDRGTVWVVDDIAEARRTHEALQQALHEMDAIMRNASVGVLITRNRRMVRYNAYFAEMFGFAGDAGVDLPARLLYRSDEEYVAVGTAAGPLLGSGKPFQQELWMRRQDGSDLWVNLIGYVENPELPTGGTIWILEDRSAFRRAELALQQAHDEQQLILDHSVVGIAFVKERLFQRCNRRLEEIYGFGPGELAGQPTRVTFLSEHSYRELGEIAYGALSRGETFATEVIHRRRNGEPFWVRITGRAIDPAQPQAGSIWNFEDVTDRKLAEESLRESETLQRAILDSANLMIVATDREGRIVTCNPATEATLGWPAEALIGRSPVDTFVEAQALDAQRAALREEFGYESGDAFNVLVARARLCRVDEREWRFVRRDGTTLPVQLTVSPLYQGGASVNGFLFVAADITERLAAQQALRRSHEELEERVKERTAELEAEMTERRRAEQRLKYLAHHDSLTGLPNRTLLTRRLDEAIENSAAQGLMMAVMFVDLDRFKSINDSLGHHVGDALLKEVARRISGALRVGDTVARIGGDEFVAVLPCLDQAQHAELLAEKLRGALQRPVHVAGHELFATPSIGICLYPQDGSSVDMLLRHADTAMYAAKDAGRNTVRRFDAAMTSAAEQHFQIEAALRRAIDRREFEPYFQPWVSLADGSLAGMEVLVRWHHPELGLVMPARFISVAEESGLIAPIGQQVLRAACEQLRAWDRAGLVVPLLAVNLSPWQFRDARLLDIVRGILAETQVEPSRIEFEITETAVMEDGEQALATLRRMKEAGFRLSVDDFGTGYSSLAYLKRFPVDKLKVDRSFVMDMTRDANDDAIVRTIVALAQTLHLKVTAEGVETAAQRDALQAIGCDFAQGYYYFRPQPAASIEIDALGCVCQA
ncbi:MAG: EAL domain-containing protein [Rhodocyclales bacterium]|nr:EAL domain-containing protein [Rhodocyclales bacterium]